MSRWINPVDGSIRIQIVLQVHLAIIVLHRLELIHLCLVPPLSFFNADCASSFVFTMLPSFAIMVTLDGGIMVSSVCVLMTLIVLVHEWTILVSLDGLLMILNHLALDWALSVGWFRSSEMIIIMRVRIRWRAIVRNFLSHCSELRFMILLLNISTSRFIFL